VIEGFKGSQLKVTGMDPDGLFSGGDYNDHLNRPEREKKCRDKEERLDQKINSGAPSIGVQKSLGRFKREEALSVQS